jgi:exonuclease SbcC
MPYRDNVPPLYFTGIHTVSICGDNGNGKSALIDAMTWALWGKTRARSDDDLIHLGRDEAEVEFDFAAGKQTYRVIRKHARPKRRRASGQTILEFQIASGEGFKSITGNSITQTQQEIIKVLHMDYPTFINSAYLRQGHADEFTQQPPVKRKEVLANILGLSFYDELEEQARELAKKQETEKALAESTIKDINSELSQRPVFEAELKLAEDELDKAEIALKEQDTRLNTLRQKKEILENKRQQLTQLDKYISENARTLTLLDSQVKQSRSRIQGYEELIARRSTIEEGYAKYIEIKRLSDELDQKLRLVTTLNERKHKLEMAIVQASQALLKEHALAENRIGELETDYQRLPQLKVDLQQVQTELNQLTREEAIISQKKQLKQTQLVIIHSLKSDGVRLGQEIAEIGEKLSLLSAQTGAKCPLCERELGEDHRRLIQAKYTAEKDQKTNSLKSDQDQMLQKETELKAMEGEISLLEARFNQSKTAAQSRISLLNREIFEAEKAGGQLVEERSRLSKIEERLASKEFAVVEQKALKELENEFSRLAYNSQQHEQARNQLASLEQYEAPRRKLEEADRLISQEKESASRAEQAALEIRQSLESDRQKREALVAELSSFPRLADELVRAESEHHNLGIQQKQAQETVGTIKGKLKRCTELEIKLQEKEKMLSQASKEEMIYRELAQAFGKKGIQAWLIEMALPEIEVEANKLLGRMTDNRMHVKIETQRETKKGDTVETLDITIADELGTRNYEMFSGGEAFRIDFAIRIALSRLLARRAGAPLPTLIIDEGFGTQDSTGLEKLKEAITSIQDDFEKIIVVTHIEEFRDAFPNRIDVIKTAEGSTIEVN